MGFMHKLLLASSALLLLSGIASAQVPDAPALVSPAADQVDLHLDVSSGLTFEWQQSAAAANYQFQLASDYGPMFPPFVTFPPTKDSITANLSMYIKGLSHGVKLWWRVRAIHGSDTGSWSPNRAFTTFPDLPLAPTLMTPSFGATEVDLSPTFIWVGAGAGISRMQLATDTNFTAIIKDTSLALTSVTIGPLKKATVYYWRVQTQNSAGTGPWSIRSSFTTQVSPLGAPVPTLPTPDEKGVSITPVLQWVDTNPPPVGPPMLPLYLLQVSTDPNFPFSAIPPTSPGSPFSPVLPYVFNGYVMLNSQALNNLAFNTKYYWRVQVSGIKSSPWSIPQAFTTGGPPPTTITLITPTHNAVDVPLTIQLQWHDDAPPPLINGMLSPHQIAVSTDVNFPPPFIMMPAAPPPPPYALYSNSMNDTITVGSLARGTKYYWRVMVPMASGGNGSFALDSFTTIPNPPDVPALVSPADAAVDFLKSSPLTWTAAARATTYHVQIADDVGFTTGVKDTVLSGTSLVFPGLADSHLYHWQVMAMNGGGNSAWSAPWSFTTAPPPPSAPSLVSPADRATGVTPGPTLQWGGSSGAATYHVQLSADSNFSTFVIDDSGLTATDHSAGPLVKAKTYYWRARAKNAGGAGEWSSLWRFTIELPPPPYQPVLIAPASYAGNVAVTPSLSWHSSSGADGYRVEVSLAGDFASHLKDVQINDTSLALAGLANDQSYHWRVTAFNAGGSSASAADLFTTIVALPEAVTLVSPSDGDTVTGDSLTALWRAGTRKIDRYWVEMSPDSGFSTKTVDSTVTDTSLVIKQAAANGRYWWHVKAHNAAGWGDFGTRRWFDVRIPATGIALSDFSLRTLGFSGGASLRYSLNQSERVTIRIYDFRGQRVAEPLDAMQGKGSHTMTLPPELLARGWYVLRFDAGRFHKEAAFRWGR
jgi:hypothetical protein